MSSQILVPTDLGLRISQCQPSFQLARSVLKELARAGQRRLQVGEEEVAQFARFFFDGLSSEFLGGLRELATSKSPPLGLSSGLGSDVLVAQIQ